MSFQPVVPLSGYAGWTFLKRTMPVQQATFQAQETTKRDEAYFREKIGSVDTAEELVADRRLLRIALGAYGLDADINNRFFIQKVLSDGTLSTGALANRLADKQYQKFSAAFGFGDFKTPANKISDFAEKTISLYRERNFEVAVGQQNADYRLALNAERELKDLAGKSLSDDTKWFTILGNVPLRKVMQTALGLPSSFAAVDLDQQLNVVKERAQNAFGSSSVSQFSDPKKLKEVIQNFLLRAELLANPTTMSSGKLALQLLRPNS